MTHVVQEPGLQKEAQRGPPRDSLRGQEAVLPTSAKQFKTLSHPRLSPHPLKKIFPIDSYRAVGLPVGHRNWVTVRKKQNMGDFRRWG